MRQISRKTLNILNNTNTNSKKTIPKSIWKLPRDKKSKPEPKNTTQGVQHLEKASLKGEGHFPTHEQVSEPRGLGGIGEG